MSCWGVFVKSNRGVLIEGLMLGLVFRLLLEDVEALAQFLIGLFGGGCLALVVSPHGVFGVLVACG